MPQKPGWINEFQFITSFFFNDCHHPPVLYLEQSFVPTVDAAHQLLALDVPQIARTLFRPKGNRQKRHGRKAQGKRRPPYTKVPDPNESVAQLLRDATGIGDTVVTDETRSLWTLLDLGESVIGKVFLVGIIEQWLYEYAMYIDMQGTSNCDVPATFGQGGGTNTTFGHVTVIGGCDSVWTQGGAFLFDGELFMPANRWMGTCSGTLTNIGNGFGDAGPITVLIGIQGDDGKFIHGSWTGKTVSYNESADFCSTFFFDNGEAIGGAWKCFQPGTGTAQGHVSDVKIFAQAY